MHVGAGLVRANVVLNFVGGSDEPLSELESTGEAVLIESEDSASEFQPNDDADEQQNDEDEDMDDEEARTIEDEPKRKRRAKVRVGRADITAARAEANNVSTPKRKLVTSGKTVENA